MRTRLALQVREHDQTRAILDGDEDSLAELNSSLIILATIFPRISPEVFREMLQMFDGTSRLHIVAEQLLVYQDEWVKGRWRTVVKETDKSKDEQVPVAVEDRFRRASYKSAVRTMLYEEFKSLGMIQVERVLVEQNFCYTRARVALQKVVSRGWRNNFNVFLSKWLKQSNSTHSDHHMMIWFKNQGVGASLVPVLKDAGDRELDEELHQNVLLPLLQKAKSEREDKDWKIAMTLNEAEARDAEAMYECQCCFSETIFEQMATCTANAHVICFRCIKNATSEALFGQGWGRYIEDNCGLLRCLALMSHGSCDGCISHIATHRAILQSKDGEQASSKLETRLAERNLIRAGLNLVHCPFCAYAEVDELYFPPSTLRYRLNTANVKVTVSLILLMLNFMPLLFLCSQHPWLALLGLATFRSDFNVDLLSARFPPV